MDGNTEHGSFNESLPDSDSDTHDSLHILSGGITAGQHNHEESDTQSRLNAVIYISIGIYTNGIYWFIYIGFFIYI